MTEYIPDTAAAPRVQNAAAGEHRRALADELRQEADATVARSEKAALLFDAGTVAEVALDRPAQAVQDYLGAYNADPRLSLALLSLLRLFERRVSRKNLERLYEAALRNARNADEKAAALVDLACLDLLQEGELDSAAVRLARALELTGAADAALLHEYVQQRKTPRDEHDAVMRRAAVCDDPLERGALLLESASRDELQGEPARALDKLRSAIEGAPDFEAFARALEMLARRNGFVPELISALDAHAERLVRASLNTTAQAETPGELVARATALAIESARLSGSVIGDAARGIATLDHALTLRPDDALVLVLRMLAHDAAGDRAHARDDARTLITLGATGDLAAALTLRLAEGARAEGDTEAAIRHTQACLEHAPNSLAAEALLDDLLIDGSLHQQRIARREARAPQFAPERAARTLIEAGRIAAFDLRDSAQAVALFKRALELVPSQHDTLQEVYGAALVLGDNTLAELALTKLLADEQDPEQRAALLLHRLELLAENDAEGRGLLRSELARENHSPALLPLARSRAAEAKDFALLAEAHRLLAHRRPPDEADAHRAAAARAAARDGDLEGALHTLEGLSGAARSQRYVLGLLEEVLTRLGRKDELTSFLRASALSDDTTIAEDVLLLSAARTEASSTDQQVDLAYRATLDVHPRSRAALLALLEARLGSEPDAETYSLLARLMEACEEPGQKAFYALLAEELREHLEPMAPASEAAMQHMLVPEAPEEAALFLLTSPRTDANARDAALEQLETRVDEGDRAALAREAGGRAIAHGDAQAVIYEAVERVRALSANDAWSAWTRTVVPLPHDEQGHVDALSELAHLSGSRAVEQAMTAEILWVRRLDGQGALAADMPAPLSEERGAGLYTHVLAAAHPVRDNELLARAYEGAVQLGLTSDPCEAKLGAARAHFAGGRVPEAKALVDAVLAEDPENPTGVELALACARKAGDFAAVADLAERLSEMLGDSHAVELLEEAAVVRRNELGDPAGEERTLKAVLARAPARASAYTLLHEFYAEHGNTDALITLVRKRTEFLDDPEQLVRCFYELARLHRGRGELAAALDAIDNVLMLEDHVGALALAAEIHTTQENYADAVSSLCSLATAVATPAAQRKLARMGAADFLEHRLGDLSGAVAQLENLVVEAPEDLQAWLKLAELAERTGKLDRAASALLSARGLETGEKRRTLSLRAAHILKDGLGRGDEAVGLYRELLEVDRADREAAFAVHALTGDAGALADYEGVLTEDLQKRPTDTQLLRDLAAVSALGKRRDDEWVGVAALVALGQADDTERARADEFAEILRGKPLPQRTLSASDFHTLRAPGLLPPYRALLDNVLVHAEGIDQLQAARFAVGKNERAAARDATELREIAASMCRVVGVHLGDIFIGGDDLTRIAALPEERAVHLVFGLGVSSSLSAQRRYRLALQIAGCAFGTLPLLTRSDEQAERLIIASMVASDVTLPDSLLREPLLALPRTLSRVLPRRARKAMPELFRALPDAGRALRAQANLALLETRALALLLAPELPPAMDEVLGMLPPADAALASDSALGMLRTWISPGFRTLRAKLELTL